jgi:hypothetical protein
MSETSTTEKLILYLFNETEFTDSVLVQRAIDYDPEVECEFENLKATLCLLNDSLVAPDQKTISKILAYSSLTRI